MKRNFNPTNKVFKGFTLIELLIVISIIGLLSTLLLANMFGIREKGRDTARKSDIAQIQRALELYKNNQNPISYVAGSSFQTLANTLEAAANDQMKTVPHDPRCSTDTNGDGTLDCTGNWVDYRYVRGTDPLTYTLTACLENKSDTAGTTCAVGDPCLAAGGLCFIRSEP